MTREEEIKKQADIYTDDASNYTEWSDDGGWSCTNDIDLVEKAFIEGAKWADNNPKSPWISVKDDLPCNHKELLLSTGYHTISVFTYKKGGACGIDNMIVRNRKWEWEAWKEDYLYWMPIPKLSKK